MNKIKLGVIFGGMSTEHDVSVVSATSIIKNLNREKYEIFPIYIDNEGKWYHYTKNIEEIEILNIGEKLSNIEPIENVLEYLRRLDVAFPVLHGLYGEDGTIQGLFELLKLKYVGCKVLGSSVCMDKAYAKVIFDKAEIKQAKYIYIKAKNNDYRYIDSSFNEQKQTLDEIAKKVKEKLGFPVFVKPSNSGSSVGIKNQTSFLSSVKTDKVLILFKSALLISFKNS